MTTTASLPGGLTIGAKDLSVQKAGDSFAVAIEAQENKVVTLINNSMSSTGTGDFTTAQSMAIQTAMNSLSATNTAASSVMKGIRDNIQNNGRNT